jgi:hypothetical protein
MPGQDGQGAEHLHLNQPPRSIEQAAGEHDVPYDLPVVLGNQREGIRGRNGLPQRIDQVGHDKAVITERPHVDVSHRLPVGRTFLAEIHARMVMTRPGSSHMVLQPEGRAQ